MALPPFRNEPLLDWTVPENRRRILEALDRAESSLGREYPLAIGADRVKTGRCFPSLNPSKVSQEVGVCHAAGHEEVERAVRVAWDAFQTWSRVPPEERAAIFLRAAELLRRRRFDFIAWEVLEVGKTWPEADAEVAEAIDHLEYFARETLRYAEPRELVPFPSELNEMVYIPLGVGACITPWNYPYGIGMGMTLGAIAAGNTVILKPAEDATVVTYLYYELMMDAGLPSGVLNILAGYGEEAGDALVRHPRIRFVGFTGSKEVGKLVYERAAQVAPGQIWLKRVITEMGGKNAAIVDEGTDIEYAVNEIAFAAYGYQGQKCSCTSRVIAVGSTYDAVLECLVERTKQVDVGPARENRFMGPLINQAALDKVLSYIELGKQEARLAYGGRRLSEGVFAEGYYVDPTVFADVLPQARIAQEEIFGPVVAVMRARDFDEALQIANGTEYGLTGSVFTRNPLHMARAKREFHVGNLYINRRSTGAWVGAHPFGGFNMSGTDVKLGGPDYLLAFLQPKLITRRYR